MRYSRLILVNRAHLLIQVWLAVAVIITLCTTGALAQRLLKDVNEIARIEVKPLHFPTATGFRQAGDFVDMEVIAYDKAGVELHIPNTQANDLFKWRVVNPVGATVAVQGQPQVLSPLVVGTPAPVRNFMRVVAGEDKGSARVEVWLKDKPEIIGRRLVASGTPMGEPSIMEKDLAMRPTAPATPTKFRPKEWIKTHPWTSAGIGVGTVGLIAIAAGGGGGSSSGGGGSGGGTPSGDMSGTFSSSYGYFSVSGTFTARVAADGTLTGTFSATVSTQGGGYPTAQNGSMTGNVSPSGELLATATTTGGIVTTWTGNVSGSGSSLHGSGGWSAGDYGGSWNGH